MQYVSLPSLAFRAWGCGCAGFLRLLYVRCWCLWCSMACFLALLVSVANLFWYSMCSCSYALYSWCIWMRNLGRHCISGLISARTSCILWLVASRSVIFLRKVFHTVWVSFKSCWAFCSSLLMLFLSSPFMLANLLVCFTRCCRIWYCCFDVLLLVCGGVWG